jgi:hypothetical protein
MYIGWVVLMTEESPVGLWLWKDVKNKEEKVKSELRRRHSDYHWVKVRKREEKMERSKEKQVVGQKDKG